MKDLIKDLKKIIFDMVSKYTLEVPEIMLTSCRQTEHGDLTTNIAFLLASLLKRSPQMIAGDLSKEIVHPMLVKVEAVSGYINFHIDPSFKIRQLAQLLALGVGATVHQVESGKRCLVEYVSANPTGPLHVGHGRQAAAADSLVNIMRACGYQVDTEYYVNDAGLQMDVLVTSVWVRALQVSGLEIAMPVGLYQGNYVVDIASTAVKQFPMLFSNEQWHSWVSVLDEPVREAIQSGVSTKDVEISVIKALVLFAKESLGSGYKEVLDFVLDIMLSGIKDELNMLGVEMERYFSEQSLVDKGSVDLVLNALDSKGYTYEREGALWFASTQFGDDKDRVLVRSNGERTYFTNDIAYHWDKVSRGYDRLINFLGSDHHGYVARLKAAVAAMGSEITLDVRLVQFVSLVSQGERIAMSTRKANFETLSDVIAECGVDATRFFYVEKHLDQPLDFDMELAVSKSQNNPVYYVQYAYARLCRLLEKGGTYALQDDSVIMGNDEAELWEMVVRLDETLQRCVDQVDPCFLAGYLFELSKKVHSYYNRVPVLNVSEPQRSMRLGLLDAVARVLAFSLKLLGVSSPEAM